jgi:hypothetical protein
MCKNNNTPQRPAPRQPPPVQPCPVSLIVRMTEIRGLYQPGVDDRAIDDRVEGTTQNSGYVSGYTSSDNRGRIFINHVPGTPPLLGNGTWTKNKQFVEITVVVDPPSVPIPAGTKITWSFEDPDDPSNEGSNVHVDAGKLLDPNDYGGSPPAKTGAAAGDNDPNGKKQESPGFEQINARYALSGNDTLIDIPTRTSKVRFNVSDIGGDNWRVKADITPIAPITSVTPATTGIMTAWNKIQVEYVKMFSAQELPVDQIALHYDMAFVQVDVGINRVLIGAGDKPFMATTDAAAERASIDLASKASGEFTMEGEKGWFFICAANLFLPATTATILYEGNAKAFGNRVRLPPGTVLAQTPVVVRIFNSALIGGLTRPKPNDHALHIKFSTPSRAGNDLILESHEYFLPEDPHHSFLDADLSHYGFASGETIPIQVLSAGDDALVTDGISPPSIGGTGGFSGRLIVFTKSDKPDELLGTMCHELCHAFDNAHLCGNWDWIDQASRTSCCMNYWFHFVLDDASPRVPIRWTQGKTLNDLCGPHLRRIRDYHLEDNVDLGWGVP